MRAKQLALTFCLTLVAVVVLGFGLLHCGGNAYYSPGPGFPGTAAVAVADINGDGKLDLVGSNPAYRGQAGFVTVRLQDSTKPGGFQGPMRSSCGVNPGNLAVGSLGGATSAVAVVNQQAAPSVNAANTVSVLLPNSAQPGAFLAPVTLPVGSRNPQDVALGDLTGQGMYAVAVAADGGSDLLLFVQTAPGVFAAPVSLPVGGVPTAVAMADLNGDGLLDLAVATSGNLVSVLLQNPASPGTFLPHVDYTVGSNPVSVKAVPFTGGLPDLMVANYGTDLAPTTQGLSVLLHDPANAGAFLAAASYSTGDYGSCSVAVGDLNGDGRPDIAVANYGLPATPGSVSVLLQDPANPGKFLAPSLYPGITGPSFVAIGDLNGNGLNDLAIADGGMVVRFQVVGQPGVFGAPVAYQQ
jgi:hypothetical protein